MLQTQCPAIDLGAFTAVADAAVDVGSAQTYNAVIPTFTVAASPMSVFLAGFFLEDVAVSMYQGLIPDIVSRDHTIALTGMHSSPISMSWGPGLVSGIASRDVTIALTGVH